MNSSNNSYNFDSEELEILKAFESGKLNGPAPSESMILAAQQTLKKNKTGFFYSLVSCMKNGGYSR